jgi:hypothetical protein
MATRKFSPARLLAVFVLVIFMATVLGGSSSAHYRQPNVEGRYVGTFRFGDWSCNASNSATVCRTEGRSNLTMCPEALRPGFVTSVVTWGDNARCVQGVCASDHYRWSSCTAAGVWSP